MSTATERIANQRNTQNAQESTSFIRSENARVNAWETGLAYVKKSVNDTLDGASGLYKAYKQVAEQKDENDFKNDIVPELMKFESVGKEGMKNGTIMYGDMVDHLYNDEYERIFNEKYANLSDKQRASKKKTYDKYIESRKYSFFSESKQFYPIQVERELENNAKLTGEQIAKGGSDSFLYDFYANTDSYSKHALVANAGDDWKVYSNSDEIREFDAFSRTRNFDTEERVNFIKENYKDVYDKAVKAVGEDASSYDIINYIEKEASSQKSRALELAQQENMAFQILKTGQSPEYAMSSITTREEEFSENVNMGIFTDLVNSSLANNNNDYSAFEHYQITPDAIDPATGKPFSDALRTKLNEEYTKYAQAVIERDTYKNSTAFIENVLPSFADAITSGQDFTAQDIETLLSDNGIRKAGLTEEIQKFLTDVTDGFEKKFKVDSVIQKGDLSLGDIDASTKINLFRVEFGDEETLEMISVGLDGKSLPKSPIGKTPEEILKEVSEMESYPTNIYDSKTGLPRDIAYTQSVKATEEMKGMKYEYDTAMSVAKLLNIQFGNDFFDVNADASTFSVVTVDMIGKMLNLIGYTDAGSKVESDNGSYSIKLSNGETVKFGSFEELRNGTFGVVSSFVKDIVVEDADNKLKIQMEKLSGYSEDVQEAFGALMQAQVMNEAQTDYNLMFREVSGTIQRMALASLYEDFENWVTDLHSRVSPNSTEFSKIYGITLSKIDAKQMIDKAYQSSIDNLNEKAKSSKYKVMKVENSLPQYGTDGKAMNRRYSYIQSLTEVYGEGHPLAGQYKTDLTRVQISAMLDPNLSEKDTDEIMQFTNYVKALSEGGKTDPVMKAISGILDNSVRKFGNTNITNAQQGFVFRALYRALKNTDPANLENFAGNFESAWSEMTSECIANTKDKTKQNYINTPSDSKFQEACNSYASQIANGDNILSTSGMVEEFKYSLINVANEDEASGNFLEGNLIQVDSNGKIKNKDAVYRQAFVTTCKALNVNLGFGADDPNFLEKATSFLTGNPLEYMIVGFTGMLVDERRKSATLSNKSGFNAHEINYVDGTTSYSTIYSDKNIVVDNATDKIVGTDISSYSISESGMDKQATNITADLNYELGKEMMSMNYAMKHGVEEMPHARSVSQVLSETPSVVESRKLSDNIYKNTDLELIPVHRIDIKLSDDNQFIVEVRTENVRRSDYENYNPVSIKTGRNIETVSFLHDAIPVIKDKVENTKKEVRRNSNIKYWIDRTESK